LTEKDAGAEICTLVRVSHIHLFGFTLRIACFELLIVDDYSAAILS